MADGAILQGVLLGTPAAEETAGTDWNSYCVQAIRCLVLPRPQGANETNQKQTEDKQQLETTPGSWERKEKRGRLPTGPLPGSQSPSLPLGDQRPNLALERKPNASLRRSSQNRNWPRHRAARKGARESSSGRSASRGRRSRLGDWGTDLVLGPVGGSGGRARDSTEAASAGPGGMPKALG